ncbi:MAG: acyltransferase [Rickettsiales bacterium]|jgi:acetyltransferase-like isoleucine patch superfamily enzyme|nr:acyltransferase [Rickettsiales bacterium]
MTGRVIFDKLHILIAIIIKTDSMLPHTVNDFLYSCFRNVPGKMGIFVRYVLLSNLVAACGKNVSIHPNVIIKNKKKLSLGNNVSIHSFCYLDATGEIKIDNNISIAHGTSILSSDHSWQDENIPIKYNPIITEKVVINDDVWIGCGVRILKGVEIQSRSVVAAGSVVNRNVESFSLVGGIPAKLIKKIK